MAEEAMNIEWIEEFEETASARPVRTSHIRSCCVFGCKSKGYRLLVEGERVQYFPFPLQDAELCHRWAGAIKLPAEVPYEKAFVCSKHFLPADYRTRVHEESKKTLRRAALPSLEPVAALTPPVYRTSSQNYDEETEEDSEEESVDDDSGTELSTVIKLATSDENDFTVLVVNSDDEDEENIHPVMKEKKKLSLVVRDLLKKGPPYPWRKLGMLPWIIHRMPFHEEHLQKVRDAITEETVLSAQEEQECIERAELLALIIIKKGEGVLSLKSVIKAGIE